MTCNKMAFASRAEAKRTMRIGKRRQVASQVPMTASTAYQCWCGAWHLTSMSKAEQRRRGLA